MFLLVWSLTGHSPAASRGFVFAFLPYRFMHYAHLELQMAQWMPLACGRCTGPSTSGRLRDGLLTGVSSSRCRPCRRGNTASSSRPTSCRSGVLLLAGEPEHASGVRSDRSWPAACSPPFWCCRLRSRISRPGSTVGERPARGNQVLQRHAGQLLAAHPRNALIGCENRGLGRCRSASSSRVLVPLIALIGLGRRSRGPVGHAAAGAAFEISLGFNGALFPWLHAHVLPIAASAVPARMAILVGLSLAIFVGLRRRADLHPAERSAIGECGLRVAGRPRVRRIPFELVLKTSGGRPRASTIAFAISRTASC